MRPHARFFFTTCLAALLLTLLFWAIGNSGRPMYYVGTLPCVGVVACCIWAMRPKHKKKDKPDELQWVVIRWPWRFSDAALLKRLRPKTSEGPLLIVVGDVTLPSKIPGYTAEPRVAIVNYSLRPGVLFGLSLIGLAGFVYYFMPANFAYVVFRNGLLVASAVAFLCTMVYWLTTHQRYLRVAPGRFQIVQGRCLHDTLRVVRDYPVDSETSAVLRMTNPSGIAKVIQDDRPTLSLHRGGKSDRMSIQRVDVDALVQAFRSNCITSRHLLHEHQLVG